MDLHSRDEVYNLLCLRVLFSNASLLPREPDASLVSTSISALPYLDVIMNVLYLQIFILTQILLSRVVTTAALPSILQVAN